jgi:DNA primase
VHGSRSGTCVVAWPETGRWWCSSCGRSGDAAGFVMAALGVKYPAAAEWLTTRYGPPANAGAELSSRRASRQKRQPYNANVRRVVLGGGAGA